MSLTIRLQELTAPDDMELPGTMQGWLAFFREYMEVEGLELFNGLNFGPATPSPEDRDKPWLKTAANLKPIALFAWDGADWTALPFIVPSSVTSARPENPTVGQKFFDTLISVELTFERGAWRTSSGSPGDIKFVATELLSDALLRNPGWIQDADSMSRFIGAAGEGTSLAVRVGNEITGNESAIITVDNLPAHAHPISGLVKERMSRNDLGIVVWKDGTDASTISTQSTDSVGGGIALPIIPPVIFRWCLIKQ
jgi:hypothetical protein